MWTRHTLRQSIAVAESFSTANVNAESSGIYGRKTKAFTGSTVLESMIGRSSV
jgi:hypothetical protein